MRFTAEQCSQLKFPVGCPVWFNLGDVGVKEASTSHPKRGVVQSALWHNNKIFYEVTHADKSSSSIVTEEVEDDKLGFGATCPITILPDNVDADADPLEGEIVLCTPSTTNPNTFVYTAMIFLDGKSKVRYESGIEEKRVVYRKVDESIVDNSSSAASGPVCKGKGAITIDDTSEATSSPKQYDNSSLMRTNNGSYDDEEGEVIEEPRRSLPPPSIMYNGSHTKREKDETKSSAQNVPSKLVILVPLWLQKDRTSQRSLFFHLIGANGCNTKRIEHETRCKVRIVRSGDTEEAPFIPMKIHIEAMNATKALRDLKTARQIIQSLVLEYVGNDGCRGRLLFEIAKHCWGTHRPNQSTSRAINDFNPFFNSGQHVFMSMVELPFVCEEGRKIFHAAHSVLMKASLERIQATGCFVQVAQSGFSIPTELCDPYVFVYGKTYRCVDRAVDIIKNVIRSHQKKCSCTY